MRAITPKEEQPGQGNRYSIEARKMKGLKKQFDEWSKPKTKVSDNGEAAEVIEDFDEAFLGEEDEVDDFEADLLADDVDDEPSDDDLEVIEAEDDLDDIEEL